MKQTSKLNLLISIALLSGLSACNASDTQPTATLLAVASTSIQPIPIPISTLIPLTIIPSPTPTQPIILSITPDPNQVERWREYEVALAKSVHPHLVPEEVLCEWDILGQAGEYVYVWAVCRGVDSGGSVPAAIQLEADGSIRTVERAQNWSRDIPRLFPAEVRGKFSYYNSGRAREMREHIEWRRMHPGEPPLIVLSTTPIP